MEACSGCIPKDTELLVSSSPTALSSLESSGTIGPAVARRGNILFATQYPCRKSNHHRWSSHVHSLKSLSFEFQNDNADNYTFFLKVGKRQGWTRTSKTRPSVPRLTLVNREHIQLIFSHSRSCHTPRADLSAALLWHSEKLCSYPKSPTASFLHHFAPLHWVPKDAVTCAVNFFALP